MTERFGDCFFGLLVLSVAMMGCGGSGTSNPTPTPPSNPGNPVPVLTSLSPSSAVSGSAGVTITLTGYDFLPTSTALWNGAPLDTSYTNAITLTVQIPATDLADAGQFTVSISNPHPGGGTSAGLQFLVNKMPPGETIVNIGANSLAWDPINRVIYLSLPSADGPNGNTVQVLDPATGALEGSTFVGSEPDLLSVSANSKYLYVGLDGASFVQRLALPNLGTDLTIPVGAGSLAGPFYAMDVQASPNSDATVAVVRGTPYVVPAEEGGVVIYDNRTARSSVLCGWIQPNCSGSGPTDGLYDSIQWNTDGTELFAADNEDTGYGFYVISVGPAGFGTVTAYNRLIGGVGFDIHYDATTGDVYDDDGSVFDPITGTVTGEFNASGIMTPDGKLGKAFFLGQLKNDLGSSTYTIESLDIRNFNSIATLTIPNVLGVPTHLIRWGSAGLAFTTRDVSGASPPSAAVYLIQGSFVDGIGPNLRSSPIQNVQRTWNISKKWASPHFGITFFSGWASGEKR